MLLVGNALPQRVLGRDVPRETVAERVDDGHTDIFVKEAFDDIAVVPVRPVALAAVVLPIADELRQFGAVDG
jgi:hypothetical protein